MIGALDWNDIRLFLEVERAGSFSAASQMLRINQATVSRRIAQLEHKAGVPLFRRSKQGASLTEWGQSLLREARDVEGTVEDFCRAMRELPRSSVRPVTIKASEGACSYLLTPLLSRIPQGPMGVVLERHPDLTFPRTRLVSDQSAEPADIELHWLAPGAVPPGGSDDRTRRVAAIRFVPFYGQAYLAKRRDLPRTAEELRCHTLITHSSYARFSGPQAMGIWQEIVADASEDSLEVDWSSSIERLLVAGAGISLLPTYSTLFSERVAALPLGLPPMCLELWIRADVQDLRDPLVRHTFDGLSRAFRAYDWG